MFLGCSLKCGGGRRVCRQTGEHKIGHSQLAKLLENFVDELRSPLRMAQKVTVVRGSSGQKAYILFARVCGQTRHSCQMIAVIAKKQQRF